METERVRKTYGETEICVQCTLRQTKRQTRYKRYKLEIRLTTTQIETSNGIDRKRNRHIDPARQTAKERKAVGSLKGPI